VGETISLNIRTLKSPNNVKIGAQCSDEEKMKFAKLLGKFQDVFAWSMRIFVVLILVLYNMTSSSRKE
jgi:hypothetical protein